MNPVNNIYMGQLLKIIGVTTRPITLQEKIDYRRNALRGMIGFVSPERIAQVENEIEKLEGQRMAAGQDELNNVSTRVELTVRDLEDLSTFKQILKDADPDVEYPPALLAETKLQFKIRMANTPGVKKGGQS